MKRSEPAKSSATTTPRATAILTIHRPLATSTPIASEENVVTWRTSQKGKSIGVIFKTLDFFKSKINLTQRINLNNLNDFFKSKINLRSELI